MCGIAGRVSRTAPVDRGELFRMIARLAHRGPDDAGYHLRAHVGLAHRRLSIIDRAHGRQPLCNEDGTVWLVYNGEVYNHLALRERLVQRGHRFRSHSDSEVIVHGYEEWGAQVVTELRGMFAFALWDEPRRRLVLARDRFGIKPLYYALVDGGGGGLVFASEQQALVEAADIDHTVDDDALAAYLLYRYVPGPATLLRGVRKLGPAHTLTWQDGRVDERRYWALPSPPPHTAIQRSLLPTEAEAAYRLRDQLDEATELRLMSEVPVGAFLSGGLDSTAVTAAMRARGDAPLHTFSVGYAERTDDADEDELGWARLAARPS
jgi:asparagine synthase (glutamine-hydrolysing)